MLFENIDKVKDMFTKYWNLENDRALVTFNAIKDQKGLDEYSARISKDKRYKNKFHLLADPQIAIQNQVERFKYSYYAGESMPIISTDIGPGLSAAMLGAIVNFEQNASVWFEHTLEEWDSYPIEFDERNIWWHVSRQLVEAAAKAAKEYGCMMGIPNDLFNGIDTLMLLRGSENLCIDLVTEPDIVKENIKKIMGYWKGWIDTFFGIKDQYYEGNCTAWLKYWGPGKTYCIQSDFMTMISPSMYEEFILPDIKEMCDQLDHTMIHFDGPDGCVRHLPFLLELKNLHGIQWNPSENCVNIRHLPTLKKIQEAGKCLVLNTTPEEIDTLLSELSPKGLLLNINPFVKPFENTDQVDELLKKVERLSFKKTIF